MPRIHYYLKGGTGEWTDLSSDEPTFLSLRFTPEVNGFIKIRDTLYRVMSGELTVPMAELPDGVYELRVDTEGEGFVLEKFEKLGGRIEMAKTEDATVRALLAKCRKNEQRLCALEEKISILIERTEGHHIFN